MKTTMNLMRLTGDRVAAGIPGIVEISKQTGFGENLRVLKWIIDRTEDRVGARETPIGYLPYPDDIDMTGIEVDDDVMRSLTSIDIGQWQAEMQAIGEYFDTFGDRLPKALRNELNLTQAKLESVAAKAS